MIQFIKISQQTLQVSNEIQLKENTQVSSLAFSPNFQEFLVNCIDGRVFKCDLDSVQQVKSVFNTRVTCIDASHTSNIIATAHSNTIQLWNNVNISDDSGEMPITDQVLRKTITLAETEILTISICQFNSSLIAVGSNKGVLRIINTGYGNDKNLFNENTSKQKALEATNDSSLENGESRVLFRQRLFTSPITSAMFDPTGKYIAAISKSENKLCLISIEEEFTVLGYIFFTESFCSAKFYVEGFDDEKNVQLFNLDCQFPCIIFR